MVNTIALFTTKSKGKYSVEMNKMTIDKIVKSLKDSTVENLKTSKFSVAHNIKSEYDIHDLIFNLTDDPKKELEKAFKFLNEVKDSKLLSESVKQYIFSGKVFEKLIKLIGISAIEIDKLNKTQNSVVEYFKTVNPNDVNLRNSFDKKVTKKTIFEASDSVLVQDHISTEAESKTPNKEESVKDEMAKADKPMKTEEYFNDLLHIVEKEQKPSEMRKRMLTVIASIFDSQKINEITEKEVDLTFKKFIELVPENAKDDNSICIAKLQVLELLKSAYIEVVEKDRIKTINEFENSKIATLSDEKSKELFIKQANNKYNKYIEDFNVKYSACQTSLNTKLEKINNKNTKFKTKNNKFNIERLEKLDKYMDRFLNFNIVLKHYEAYKANEITLKDKKLTKKDIKDIKAKQADIKKELSKRQYKTTLEFIKKTDEVFIKKIDKITKGTKYLSEGMELTEIDIVKSIGTTKQLPTLKNLCIKTLEDKIKRNLEVEFKVENAIDNMDAAFDLYNVALVASK